MTRDVIKSQRLQSFLTANGLQEKFNKEVRKWNPLSYHTKVYDDIIGSFRFKNTADGTVFWERVNDQYESLIEEKELYQFE